EMVINAPQRRKKSWRGIVGKICEILLVLFCAFFVVLEICTAFAKEGSPRKRRDVENETQCVSPQSSEFPGGFFTKQERKDGSIYIIKYAVGLGLSPDVAGATDFVPHSISVAAVIAVISDNKVYWYDAVFLLLVYTMYIAVLSFDAHVHGFMWHLSTCICKQPPLISYDDRSTLLDQQHSTGDSGIFQDDTDFSHMSLSLHGLSEIADNHQNIFTMPENDLKRILWVLSLPAILLLYLTIPDCRKRIWKRWFILTFLMSAVWISAFTYILVWMVTVVGEMLRVPETVMGLTLLAVGTSRSMRKRDMAMSNVIGSNVFDMLCLGLPWFIKTVVMDASSHVAVNSTGLLYTACTLLLSVFLLFMAVHLNHWRLDWKLGLTCLFFYILFTTLAILYELGIIGNNPVTFCNNNQSPVSNNQTRTQADILNIIFHESAFN
uniref:Solute carrier family 24 member 5 n=1 Tax=Scleropages formosus TaxID=113540 RepID=A0A8C9V6Y0_SCLFO